MPGAYNRSLNSVKLKVGDELLCSSIHIIPLMTDQVSRQLLHHAHHFSCYHFDQILYGCMEVDFKFDIDISLPHHG
jgi:hypothetical protein